ncbi:hypothetical protein D3C72_1945260 [compost metagenome]
MGGEAQDNAIAGPAALCQPAGDTSDQRKGGEITGRRPCEMGKTAGAIGKNRKPEHGLSQPGKDGGNAKPPTIDDADHRDGKGLHGHRHRNHRHADLRGKREKTGSNKHEQCLDRPGFAVEAKRIEERRVGGSEIGHLGLRRLRSNYR